MPDEQTTDTNTAAGDNTGGDAGADPAAAAAADTTGAGDAGSSAPPASADPSADQAGEGDQKSDPLPRPDWMPGKFYDEATGEVRIQDLANSYTALEQRIHDRNGKPPEAYELPNGWSEHEDHIDPQSVEEIKAVAQAEGYSQQGYERLLKAILGDPVKVKEQLRETYGDQLPNVIGSVKQIASTFPKEHQAAINQLGSTAEGVAFLFDLRKRLVDAALPGNEVETGDQGDTEADIKKLMASPEYYGPNGDPKIRARVDAWFAKNHQGEQPTADLNSSRAR